MVQVWLFSFSHRLHSTLTWTESVETVLATTQNTWLMLCTWRCLGGHCVFCSKCPSSVPLRWRAWCGRVRVLPAWLEHLSLWRMDRCLDPSLICLQATHFCSSRQLDCRPGLPAAWSWSPPANPELLVDHQSQTAQRLWCHSPTVGQLPEGIQQGHVTVCPQLSGSYLLSRSSCSCTA